MAGGGEDGGSVERKILSVGNNLLEDLASRLDEELESLPFGTKKEAWSAVRKLITNEEIDMWSSEDEDGVESEEATGEGGASIKRRSILQGKKAFRRVIKAEKAAEKLDKELKEASKARETKLRNAGVLERARMNSGTGKDASGLKEAEENVNSLRLELALVTLQLEMRLVFEYLEKEALQIIDENGNFLPWRRGR